MNVQAVPSLADVVAAHSLIAGHIHRTPIVTCASLDAVAGCRVFFKCENFQKTGAFKFRGATHALLRLDEAARARGVVTHSSGNHGASLAHAASRLGVRATIVMPENSSRVKLAAVRHYGGEIHLCEPGLAARQAAADEALAESGGTFVHPFNDTAIVCGQGTAALELIEGVSAPLDALLAPVGGGGLLSGCLIAAKGLIPGARVIGCEPQQVDDAFRSWKSGKLCSVGSGHTIADGLRTELGDITFSVIQELVDEIAIVGEEEIVAAMKLIWTRAKIVVEASAAVPFAVLMKGRPDLEGKRVGVILSGGNVDVEALPF